MKAKRRLYLFFSVLALMLAAGPVAQAFAQATVTVIPVDTPYFRTYLSNVCGFTILRQNTGSFRIIDITDQSGNLRREVELDHLVSTFTANGHTLVAHYRAANNATFNPDGSITVLVAGVGNFIVMPGQGPIAGGVGSGTFMITPSGDFVELRASGPDYGYDQFCAALAP